MCASIITLCGSASAATVPSANFTSNVTSGAGPLTVQFNDTSTGNPTSWNWNFGDNQSSTVQNPTHTYTTVGNYSVSLAASNNAGTNTINKTHYISVNNPTTNNNSSTVTRNGNLYVAEGNGVNIDEIYPNGTVVQLGNGYQFNEPDGLAVDSKGDVYVADWGNNAVEEIYPNGTVTTLGNGYTFSGPLSIAVDSRGNVYVADGNNWFEEILTNGTVNQLGIGTIVYDAESVAVDSQDNVYVGEDGARCVWEFCTNGTINEIGIGSNFSPWGVAVDSQGNVYVTDPISNGVWEIYTNGTKKELGRSNEAVQLAVDPNGNVYVADWNDNIIQEMTNGTTINPITGYEFNGPMGIAYQELPPVANFTENNTNGLGPLNVQFNDQSTGDITSYAWDFNNDGTIDSTEQNPTCTFNAPGTYTVTETVTGPGGNNTYTDHINVNYPAPVANFTVDNTNVTEPQSVNFTDKSTGNITSYNWDFGDGTISTEQNPTHKYTTAGNYTVTETVTGLGGSDTQTLTDYITINPDTTAPIANATLASGIFNSNQTVGLSATDNDPNLKIYYTINGTTPTTNSTLYSNPLTISKEGTTTLEFIAVDTAGNISNTVTRTYTIDTTLPTASANPIGGLYNTTENVSLSMSEAGTIYYTTDGSAPNNTSSLYSGPIMVSKNTTLRYIAIDEAGNVSSVYTQTYTIDKTIPTASANVKGGLYNTNKVVTLTMSEPGNIYYTLNGTTPTSKSTLYTKPITITSTTTLKYLAIDLANNKSSTYVQNYTIDKTAPTIVKTNPKYNAINVPLTTPLTITFSENILKGINYNNIYVKNVNTGKLVQITKTLSKNTLTIKMIKSRLHNDKYIIYIPKDAFKDLAGNLTAAYTIKFKTG